MAVYSALTLPSLARKQSPHRAHDRHRIPQVTAARRRNVAVGQFLRDLAIWQLPHRLQGADRRHGPPQQLCSHQPARALCGAIFATGLGTSLGTGWVDLQIVLEITMVCGSCMADIGSASARGPKGLGPLLIPDKPDQRGSRRRSQKFARPVRGKAMGAVKDFTSRTDAAVKLARSLPLQRRHRPFICGYLRVRRALS